MCRGRALGTLSIGTALACSLVLGATPARADGPRIASDAFWIGLRVGPDSALIAGWDLDVYLTDDTRQLSVGPGVTFSVLGEGAPFGTQQEFSLVVDVVRLKVQLNDPEDSDDVFRPYVFIGGGFDYVFLRAATETVEVTPPGGMPVTGTRTIPELREFQGIYSMGGGIDLFTGGAWAVSAIFNNHFRLGGSTRVPVVWIDMALGIRFGI